MTGGYPPEIVDAALTVRPRWLAGLIARHGQPTLYQPDPVRLGESRYSTWAWVGLGVQVEQTLTTWTVTAHRNGIRAKLAGLRAYPTDAQISAVVALAGLDDAPGRAS
jgi:hypothetical protein